MAIDEERQVEFPKGEPDYWFAEFDVEAKVLEIGIDEITIRIPQEKVLSWFMVNEYQVNYCEKCESNSLKHQGPIGEKLEVWACWRCGYRVVRKEGEKTE